MQQIDVNSWEEFEEQVRAKQAVESRRFLYRGQHDSNWDLTTTLDRKVNRQIPIAKYHALTFDVRAHLESLTGQTWALRDHDEMIRDLESRGLRQAWQRADFPSEAEYSYLAHLRHHGFPSPLLDWTRSPYVAAFFAFRHAAMDGTKRASIYVLSINERIYPPTQGTPQIDRIGSYIKTHRRHFLQQSEYTICVAYKGKDSYFTSHQTVIEQIGRGLVWRFTMPSTERLKVLKRLDAFNLNAYSLFNSEEALLETLAVREMEFRLEDS